MTMTPLMRLLFYEDYSKFNCKFPWEQILECDN